MMLAKLECRAAAAGIRRLFTETLLPLFYRRKLSDCFRRIALKNSSLAA
jgi:hypothetical protein